MDLCSVPQLNSFLQRFPCVDQDSLVEIATCLYDIVRTVSIDDNDTTPNDFDSEQEEYKQLEEEEAKLQQEAQDDFENVLKTEPVDDEQVQTVQEPVLCCIYVLYNPSFRYYHQHMYKIGCTNNITQVLNTSNEDYLEPSSLLYVYTYAAENIEYLKQVIFEHLNLFRYKNTHDFFVCNLMTIIDTIERCAFVYNY